MVISFFEMFLAAGYTVMSVVRRIDPTMLRFLNFTLLNSSEPIDHAALTSVEGWIGISDGVVMFLVALVGFLGTMRENVFLLLIFKLIVQVAMNLLLLVSVLLFVAPLVIIGYMQATNFGAILLGIAQTIGGERFVSRTLGIIAIVLALLLFTSVFNAASLRDHLFIAKSANFEADKDLKKKKM